MATETGSELSRIEVDSSQLGIKDLPYVRAALINVSAHWYMIGMCFKVETNKLDQIRRDNMRNSDHCLTVVIAEWLVNPEGCPPTWRNLVDIIAAKCGGDNPQEALRVANQHQAGNQFSASPVSTEGVDDRTLSTGALHEVVSMLVYGNVGHKWFEIGVVLGLSYGDLMALKYSPESVHEQVMKIVSKWLEGAYDTAMFGKASWKKLVEVIGSRAGGDNQQLAAKIAAEHQCPGTTSESESTQSVLTGAASKGEATPLVQDSNPQPGDAPRGDIADLPLSELVNLYLDRACYTTCLPSPAVSDHGAVSGYLYTLDMDEVSQLGVEMGLNYRWLRDTKASAGAVYREEVVDAWLRQRDGVKEKCPPTWRNLVLALCSNRIRQNGLADRISREKGFSAIDQ